MRKLIFAANATIDGFADHTAVIADDELHDFYTNLLDDVDILLFGRKTYQLMEGYWPKASEDPKATKSIIEFANKINSLRRLFDGGLPEAALKLVDSKLLSSGILLLDYNMNY